MCDSKKLDNFYPIPNSIPIIEIKDQKTSRAKITGNLLKLGKLHDFSDLDADHRRLKRTLKKVSENISNKFKEFGVQEKNIEIEVEKQANDLAFSIYEGISLSSPPDERSEGFRWLLSFFSHFASNLEFDWEEKIFLIDEPAVLLHPKGQKAVLNILEKISKKSQVIYSTHSPFLINRNFP